LHTNTTTLAHTGAEISLATPNYKHQKKQREQAQKKKKDEKEQRKAEKKEAPLPTPSA
jgi:hypothetical protein